MTKPDARFNQVSTQCLESLNAMARKRKSANGLPTVEEERLALSMERKQAIRPSTTTTPFTEAIRIDRF